MKPKASSLKIYTILTKLLPDSSRKKEERPKYIKSEMKEKM